MLVHQELTSAIIGAAIQVHKTLGPGLVEAAYEECLCQELQACGISFTRQVPLPAFYRERRLDHRYRLDLLVDGKVVVEIKSVERILRLHESQLITYLRVSGVRVGLLMNFNVPALFLGIRRFVV